MACGGCLTRFKVGCSPPYKVRLPPFKAEAMIPKTSLEEERSIYSKWQYRKKEAFAFHLLNAYHYRLKCINPPRNTPLSDGWVSLRLAGIIDYLGPQYRPPERPVAESWPQPAGLV